MPLTTWTPRRSKITRFSVFRPLMAPVHETPAAYMSASALDGDKSKGLPRLAIPDPSHRTQTYQPASTNGRELIQGLSPRRNVLSTPFSSLTKKKKITFEFPPRIKKKLAINGITAYHKISNKKAEIFLKSLITQVKRGQPCNND